MLASSGVDQHSDTPLSLFLSDQFSCSEEMGSDLVVFPDMRNCFRIWQWWIELAHLCPEWFRVMTFEIHQEQFSGVFLGFSSRWLLSLGFRYCCHCDGSLLCRMILCSLGNGPGKEMVHRPLYWRSTKFDIPSDGRSPIVVDRELRTRCVFGGRAG